MSQRKSTAILTTEGLRLLQIERALRRDRVVTMADLRTLTGASLATIKRDLVALREELGAPIVWDRFEGGYRIEGSWVGVIAAGLYETGLAA